MSTWPNTAEMIRIISSLVFAFLTVRATCKVLDMRSNALYAAYYLCNTFMNLVMINNRALEAIRVLLLNFLTGIYIPLSYSRGPLRTRIIRIGLILLCLIATELICSLAYLLILQAGIRTEDISTANPLTVMGVYCIGIPTMALSLELVINACARHDNAHEASLDANLGLSIAWFNLGTYFLFAFAIMRLSKWQGTMANATTVSMTSLVCFALSVLLDALFFAVASYDARATREHSEHIAVIRRIRHAKVEVSLSTTRSFNVRLFRHDLADQIDIVEELAREGNIQEAGRYLSLLQMQTRDIMGEPHE